MVDVSSEARRPNILKKHFSKLVFVMAAEESRLVVAIDYGTTFTGVAWTTTLNTTANLDEITVVSDWGARMSSEPKVPSVISYSKKTPRKERQWGLDLSKDAVTMIHTKLQLKVDNTSTELALILQQLEGMHDLDYRHIENSLGSPQYTMDHNKAPVEIVQDYLRKIFESLMKINEFSEQETDSVDIVATIPADWDYAAKNATFRALTGAGFNKLKFPKLRDMILVTEPEAAAIYTARYLKERDGADFLRVHESFILCDAGGGTVDVASYKVKRLEPLQIERTGIPVGDKCGAIFVNLEFKKWLRGLIGIERYQLLDQVQISDQVVLSHNTEGARMRALMENFESQKKLFTNDGRDVRIEFPEPHSSLHLPDKGIDKGLLTIPFETMEFFFWGGVPHEMGGCVGGILKLIQGQRDAIDNDGSRLKNVFLVGGFAESPYLREKITEALELMFPHDEPELRIPDTSLTAVVRGAAVFGIEKSINRLPRMDRCPRSYGVALSFPYSVASHDPKDRKRDELTNMDMAEGQLRWMIMTGDLILSDDYMEVGRPFNPRFTRRGSRAGSIPIHAYDPELKGHKHPIRVSNSRLETAHLHDLEYDLANIELHEFEHHPAVGRQPEYFVASLTLKMRIAPGILYVSICHGRRVISSIQLTEALLLGLDTLTLDQSPRS